jgi:HTH-type transcriptional regulator / antitoxin HipB
LRRTKKGPLPRPPDFWRRFFDGHSVVVLTHGLIKKTQKTPQREIERAEAYRRLFTEEVKEMSDLKKYVAERKKRDKTFAEGYDEGYEQFKIGVVLKQTREKAGLTQEELAHRLKTKKTAISRIENHAEDIKLSTLEKVAHALGKRLEVKIA